MDDQRVHLVRLSDGAVVETEEVDELIQELTDAAAGDVHGAAKSLSGRQTGYSHRKKQHRFGLKDQVWNVLHSRGELPNPEEVVPHADGELVASQPQHAHRRGGQLRDAASDAGQLTAEQLLPVQRGLAGKRTKHRSTSATCGYHILSIRANVAAASNICQYGLMSATDR